MAQGQTKCNITATCRSLWSKVTKKHRLLQRKLLIRPNHRGQETTGSQIMKRFNSSGKVRTKLIRMMIESETNLKTNKFLRSIKSPLALNSLKTAQTRDPISKITKLRLFANQQTNLENISKAQFSHLFRLGSKGKDRTCSNQRKTRPDLMRTRRAQESQIRSMWPRILEAKEFRNKITRIQGQKISIKIQSKLEVPVGNCGAKPYQVKRQLSQNNKVANRLVSREIEDP